MQKDLIENYFFDLSPKANIYRYTTVNRLFQMFDDKRLVLVQPSKWDDPFENMLSNVIYNDGRDKISLRGITEKYVGQCWTKSKECDGLWRNYTNMGNNPNNGVKITTKVEKLFKYVANCEKDKFAGVNTFIGNVNYSNDQEIINFFQSIDINWITDTSGKNPSKTLFLKRNEFKYENEVRVIKYVEDNSRDEELATTNLIDDGKYYVEINPLEFISSVVFSPMMEKELYIKNKNRLIKLGFDEKKISKSKLYDSITEAIIIKD